MTDKQIIIDGCNVSGCGFYHSETGTECHIALAFAEEYTDDNHTYFKCEQNPNCYFKQLKYLEKAFDYREKTYLTNLNNLADEAKFLREKLHSKEQECEELKEKLDYFKKCNKDLDNYIPAFRMGEFGYIKKSEVLTSELEQLKAENEKLKQTLAEIKEIAEDTKDKFYDAIHTGGL